MKNFMKIATTICGTMALAATAAFASIAPQQAAIGGIEPGMTLEQAQSIGGKIVSSDAKKLVFENGVIAKVDDDRPGIVEEVTLKSGTAKTAAGISLGMGADALNNAYGHADKVDYDRHDTEYIYYTTDGTKKIEFKVKNGVIVKISCELRN